MRIAVASMKAYLNHGLHAAEQFFVFDVRVGISFVEKRENRFREQVSSPNLHGIAELLRDARSSAARKPGRRPSFLRPRGVEMEMSEGPIDEKLKGFIESLF